MAAAILNIQPAVFFNNERTMHQSIYRRNMILVFLLWFNLETTVGADKKAQSFDPEPLDAGVN